MNRVVYDLALVLLVIIGWIFLLDMATGEVSEGEAQTLMTVNAIVLTLYLMMVIIPHYVMKIGDADVRSWLKSIGLFLPLLLICGLLSLQDELIGDPSKRQLIIAVYALAVLTILWTVRFVYLHYWLKRKNKMKEELE